LSGAIQDWDRGIIIGRRSFGKGLVQRPFYLTDGSAIRLTVSQYFTPSGRFIQKSYDDGVDKYHKELRTRRESGELIGDTSFNFPDSLKFFTIRNNRVVYGGGGIMPDVFIPIDTSYFSDYFTEVIGKGVLNEFVMDYIDTEREKLKKKYPEAIDFVEKFEITASIMNDFIEFAEQADIEENEEDMAISGDRLKIQLKAMIARNLWSIEAFYQVINQTNETFNKALEVMKDGTFKQMKIASK
jgi:carboxyl-terminal processing protease